MAIPLRPPQRNDEARERFEEAATAVAELVEAIDTKSPFYPKELYRELDALRVLAKKELSRVADETMSRAPGQPGARDFWDELKERVERISDAIRNRLERLSILPSDGE